jgi:hypothetical protein
MIPRSLAVLATCAMLGACATVRPNAPQPYVIFFAGSSTGIPAEGAAIVANAIADAQLHPRKLVAVAGPSTKAAPGYEPGLAEPRISAVEKALAAAGIDPKRIVRTPLETSAVKVDATGAQRVEIRIVDAPNS